MKKILVTGGAGFIGGNFVHYMVNKYPEYMIVNLDALTYAGNLETLKPVEDKPSFALFEKPFIFPPILLKEPLSLSLSKIDNSSKDAGNNPDIEIIILSKKDSSVLFKSSTVYFKLVKAKPREVKC